MGRWLWSVDEQRVRMERKTGVSKGGRELDRRTI